MFKASPRKKCIANHFCYDNIQPFLLNQKKQNKLFSFYKNKWHCVAKMFTYKFNTLFQTRRISSRRETHFE